MANLKFVTTTKAAFDNAIKANDQSINSNTLYFCEDGYLYRGTTLIAQKGEAIYTVLQQTIEENKKAIANNLTSIGLLQKNDTLLLNAINLKADSNDVYTKDQVYTKTEVNAEITSIENSISGLNTQVTSLSTSKADKDDVYTKDEVYTKESINAQIDVIDGEISDLTEQVKLKANSSEVYTKTNIDVMLENKADKETTYTKTEVNDLLSAKASTTSVSDLTEVVNTKADKSTLEALTTTVNEKANQSALNTLNEVVEGHTTSLNNISETLENKANSEDVYTKKETYNQTEVNSLLSNKADTQSVSDSVSGLQNLINQKVDSDDVYTKDEIDSKVSTINTDIGKKANQTDLNTLSSNVSTISGTLDDVKKDVDDFFKDATISEAAKDTLAEIQKYIEDDASAAASMTASIQQNADNITSLDGRLDTAESDITNLKSADTTLSNSITTINNSLSSTGTIGKAISGNTAAISNEVSRATGVESELQNQITAIKKDYLTSADKETLENTKQNNIEGAASTVTSNDLATDKALISNANGKIAVSEVSSEELGYLKGVGSLIQTQLDNKYNKTDVVDLAKADADGRIISETYETKDNVNTIKGEIENSISSISSELSETSISAAQSKNKLLTVEEGAQVNIIEKIQINGNEIVSSGKVVNLEIPTGKLANLDEVSDAELENLLKQKIEKIDDKVDTDTYSTAIENINNTLEDHTTAISNLQNAGHLTEDSTVITTLVSDVANNSTKVNILNSNSNTEGSVDYKIAEALEENSAYFITAEERDFITFLKDNFFSAMDANQMTIGGATLVYEETTGLKFIY